MLFGEQVGHYLVTYWQFLVVIIKLLYGEKVWKVNGNQLVKLMNNWYESENTSSLILSVQ